MPPSQSSTYWKEKLPHVFAPAAFNNSDNQESQKECWTEEQWKEAETVYRLGRTQYHPDVDGVQFVKDGLVFLDCTALERRKARVRYLQSKTTTTTASLSPSFGVVFHDPWLLRAWRQVVVAQHEDHNDNATANHDDSILSHSAMAQNLEEYLETGIFAWDARLLQWIVDAWQATAANNNHNPNDLLRLIDQVTLNYSPHRPLNKFVVMRVLQILAPHRQYAEQATALVQKLQETAALFPNDSDVQVDLQLYAAWAHVWAASRRKDAGVQALQILRQAQKENQIGIVLYNTVLHALCASRDVASIEQAHVLWREMSELDLRGITAETWTPLFRARLERQEWRAAVRLWRFARKHRKDNVRPHFVARQSLERVLQYHAGHWQKFLDNNNDNAMPEVLPQRVDWRIIGQEWEMVAKEFRQTRSYKSLAQAFLFLDQISLAAVVETPSWAIPTTDMEEMMTIQRRLHNQRKRQDVSLDAILTRLRKYQGIGLLRPGSTTLDWMIMAVEKVSQSPMEAAVAAQTFLDETVEDFQYDVRHPDFINKVPVTRLINLWAQTPESTEAAEVVWETLWGWYNKSGEKANLKPDDDGYMALISAWKSSTKKSRDDTARRVWQLWLDRVEQLKGTRSQPTIELYHQVATVMAEAGKVEETEALVSEVLDGCSTGRMKFRKDIDFVALRVLALCQSGNSADAFKILLELEKGSATHQTPVVLPSSLCYDIVLTGFAKEGQFEIATKVLDHVVGTNLADQTRNIRPSESSWRTLLTALASSDSADTANQAILLLEKSRFLNNHLGDVFSPDVFLYNSVLQALLRHPKPREFRKEAETIFQKMKNERQNAKPNELTYNLFLRILVNADLPGKAMKCLQQFCRLSLEKSIQAAPETDHFRTVITMYLKFGDENGVKKAVELLRLMQGFAEKTDWNIHPDEQIYRSILRVCKEASVSPDIAEEVLEMLEVQATMQKGIVRADAEMLVDIISCLADSDPLEGSRRILELAQKISREELSENAELYRTLVEAFARRGLRATIRVLASEMEHRANHCVVSLETFVNEIDHKNAINMTDHIIDQIQRRLTPLESSMETVARVIKVWKTSKAPEAGRQAERLLQAMYGTERLDSKKAPFLFADVIWSYIYAEDSTMAEAADRLIDRCRDFLGSGSFNLNLFEAAAVAHLHQVPNPNHGRVLELLECVQEVVKAETRSEDETACSRLEASIEHSSLEQKDHLLLKLRQIISDRAHEQDGSEHTTATTVL